MDDDLVGKVRQLATDATIRQAVGEVLGTQPPRKPSMWQVLNSPFALWLLSSVLITVLTWAYSEWSATRAKEAERVSRINQLDVEIAYRLGFGSVTEAEFQETFCLPASMPAGAPPTLRVRSQERYIYPDLANRSVVSLLWELENLVPDAERGAIHNTRLRIGEIASQTKESNSTEKVNLEPFLLPRWQSFGLAHVQ